MRITEKLDHKRILIWGKGREGKSTETFLKEHCPSATYDLVGDANKVKRATSDDDTNATACSF